MRALSGLALLSHYVGDDEASRRYATRAMQVSEPLSPWQVAITSIALGHALEGLAQPAKAADAYRQSLDLFRKWDVPDWLDPAAGLARVAQSQGDRARALAYVQEMPKVLETRPGLGQTAEPLRVYLTCHQVLRAHDDPRAEELLHAAYCLLQERAAKIEDEDWRRSYLENVPYHREIIAAWQETSHP